MPAAFARSASRSPALPACSIGLSERRSDSVHATAASVWPARSSTSWAWMPRLERNTEMRGRSAVPDAARFPARGDPLAGLARLLHRLERAQVRLRPRHRRQRVAGEVVDELGVDAAVGAEHRDARALGGADDLRPHAAAALEARLALRDDGHARLPTFRATYSPS